MGHNDDWVNQLFKSAEGEDESDARMMLANGPEYVSTYLNNTPGNALESRHFKAVQAITAKARAAAASVGVSTNLKAGTRVAFVATAESLFSYKNPPDPGMGGTVVTAKVAGSHVTSHEGRVFVRWDDGKLRATLAQHMTLHEKQASRKASKNRIRVGSSLDAILGEYLKVSNDTLVNRSSRDLWGVTQDEGGYVISRLFDDQGEPLKLA